MKAGKSEPIYPQNHAFEILWLIVLKRHTKVSGNYLPLKILINFMFTTWKFGYISKLAFYLGLHNQKELLSVDLDCHSSFIKSSSDYFWQQYWILEGLPSAVNFLRVNAAGIPEEIQCCLIWFLPQSLSLPTSQHKSQLRCFPRISYIKAISDISYTVFNLDAVLYSNFQLCKREDDIMNLQKESLQW